MNKFEYLTPATIDEAISFCISHGERAKYIAGVTYERSVLPPWV